MAKKKISPEAQAILSASDAGYHATTVALVEKFLIDNPQHQRAWLDLGHSLTQLARYDQAQAAFEKAIEFAQDQRCDVVFGELGNLFRIRGDFETAIKWYQKQIDTDPDDATGYLFLANVLMKQGGFDKAETTLKQGLQCSQGCLEEVHYSLGLLQRTRNQLAQAKASFETVLELDPKYDAAKVALKDVKSALSIARK